MTILHARTVLASVVLAGALAVLPGCGGGGRVTTFPIDAAPAATTSHITVRITEALRRPGELELAIAIINRNEEPVLFARKYSAFFAATVVHGEARITGERTPKKSRTPNQYIVISGETASLRLVFRAADLDRAADLTLHLVGSTHGASVSWTIPIPPEPPRPMAAASIP